MSGGDFEPPPEDFGAPEDLEAFLADLGEQTVREEHQATDPGGGEAEAAAAAGGTDSAGVEELRSRVEEILALVADPETGLAAHTEKITELGEGLDWAVDQLTAYPAGGPWLWAALDTASTKALWKELGEFVAWLNTRILHNITSGDLAAPVPGCWFRHPDAVEQLTALMVAHKAAYHPKVKKPSFELVNWFDRALWPTMRALGTNGNGTFANCVNGTHRDKTVETYRHDDGFAEYAGLNVTVTSDGEVIADA